MTELWNDVELAQLGISHAEVFSDHDQKLHKKLCEEACSVEFPFQAVGGADSWGCTTHVQEMVPGETVCEICFLISYLNTHLKDDARLCRSEGHGLRLRSRVLSAAVMLGLKPYLGCIPIFCYDCTLEVCSTLFGSEVE